MGLLRRALVGIVAVGGLLLRWWTLHSPTGAINADEIVTGLGAMEALHGRLDVVIPGGAYTANFESYLFAPIVQFFGAHITPLKLMPVVLWAVASWLIWRLVRRAAGPDAGLLAGCLVWLAPGALGVLSTRAYLAYPGGLALVSGSLLLLAVELDAPESSSRRVFGAGFIVGMAVWAHPLYLAMLAPASAVVLWHRRAGLVPWLARYGFGCAAGMSPWLAWNVVHGFPSLRNEALGSGTVASRFAGLFRQLLPRDLGLRDPTGVWLHGRLVGGAFYICVLVLATVGAVQMSRSGRVGRMLAICLIAVWPLLALFPAVGYVADGRYGLFTVPVLFGATAVGVLTILNQARSVLRFAGERQRRASPLALAVALAIWTSALVLPYQSRVIGHHWEDPNARLRVLVNRLESEGFQRVAGSYWVVLPITYVSNGRIPSAVTSSLPERYPELQRLVEASDPMSVPYVFEPWSDDPAALMMPSTSYTREEFAGYVLYLPKGVG